MLSNPLPLIVRRKKAKFIYKDFLLVSVIQNEKENELEKPVYFTYSKEKEKP